MIRHVIDRVGDRLNPILVKEIRQALRSRYFRGSYVITLLIATLLGTIVLLPNRHRLDVGEGFFAAIYACLVFAVMGLVPFQAFLSVGITWEREQLDALNLTDLRPSQIVRGRLWSSLVQGGLIVIALLPFLALSYLLPGTDPLGMALCLVMTLAAGAMLVCVALAMSWLSTNRLGRVLLLAVLGMLLMSFCWAAFMSGVEVIDSASDFQRPEGRFAIVMFLSMFASVGGLCLVGATARISHPEENRSTGMRLFILGVLAISAFIPYAVIWYLSPASETVIVTVVVTLFGLMLPMSLVVTEPERLGRRVQRQVPRNSLVALLLHPLFPGGGSGALFVILAVSAYIFLFIVLPPHENYIQVEYTESLIVVWAYTLAALLFPSAVSSLWTRSATGRTLAVFFIPLSILFVLGAPILIGLILDIESWGNNRHPGNPSWVLQDIHRRDAIYSNVAIVWAMLGALINVPRIVKGFLRTERAATENRARHAATST